MVDARTAHQHTTPSVARNSPSRIPSTTPSYKEQIGSTGIAIDEPVAKDHAKACANQRSIVSLFPPNPAQHQGTHGLSGNSGPCGGVKLQCESNLIEECIRYNNKTTISLLECFSSTVMSLHNSHTQCVLCTREPFSKVDNDPCKLYRPRE